MSTIEKISADCSARTLSSRASSSIMFARWRLLKVTRTEVFGVTEEVCYNNVENLRPSGAPATTASSFIESLGFAAGLLGLGVDQSVLESPRVKGAVCRNYARKRITEKATPFTKDVGSFRLHLPRKKRPCPASPMQRHDKRRRAAETLKPDIAPRHTRVMAGRKKIRPRSASWSTTHLS